MSFSSITGVHEDVTDIVLNIKAMALRMYAEGPKRMSLKAKGPGAVTASMIETGPDIEIMDPDHVICTLGRRCGSQHGIHGRARQRLCAGGPEPAGRCADRPDPGRCDLQPRGARSPTRSRTAALARSPTTTSFRCPSTPTARLRPRTLSRLPHEFFRTSSSSFINFEEPEVRVEREETAEPEFNAKPAAQGRRVGTVRAFGQLS